MSNLQPYRHCKLDFQKGDQYTGGKELIHSTKSHKDTVAKLGTPLYNILSGNVNMT